MSLGLRNLSLRGRLVLISVSVCVLGLSAVFFYISRGIERMSRGWLERRAVGIARVVSHAVASGLEFDDARSAREFLSGLAKEPEALYAVVHRSNGTVLATWRSDRMPQVEIGAVPEVVVRWSEDQLRVDAPVLARGGAAGTLSVGFSSAELVAEKQKNQVLVGSICVLVALAIALTIFLTGTLLVRPIREMTAVALRIANGDLSQEQLVVKSRDEVGQMANAFNQVIAGLRAMVHQVGDTSVQLANAASELHAAAQAQEAAAGKQSAGVEEVSRTMQSLLESASHIAESAQGVLANAQRTKETADLTSGRIAELSVHTNRIAELLEVIRDIADRSDLLALNASLEATRAGEAGRAFSLVAGEMRRLAERVTASVQDVKSLVADVRASGASTVLATEEGRKLTEGTTESARQITVVTQQQRTGTEQVSLSMLHISSLLTQFVTAAQQTRTSAGTLKTHADRLSEVVGRFRLVQGEAEPKDRHRGAA